MLLIEINAQPNGAHRNQTIERLTAIPDGWAVVPNDMVVPEIFPFVAVDAANGVVTQLTPGIVPAVAPPVSPPNTDVNTPRAEQDDMAALLVDHEYRLTLLELGLADEGGDI